MHNSFVGCKIVIKIIIIIIVNSIIAKIFKYKTK